MKKVRTNPLTRLNHSGFVESYSYAIVIIGGDDLEYTDATNTQPLTSTNIYLETNTNIPGNPTAKNVVPFDFIIIPLINDKLNRPYTVVDEKDVSFNLHSTFFDNTFDKVQTNLGQGKVLKIISMPSPLMKRMLDLRMSYENSDGRMKVCRIKINDTQFYNFVCIDSLYIDNIWNLDVIYDNDKNTFNDKLYVDIDKEVITYENELVQMFQNDKFNYGKEPVLYMYPNMIIEQKKGNFRPKVWIPQYLFNRIDGNTSITNGDNDTLFRLNFEFNTIFSPSYQYMITVFKNGNYGTNPNLDWVYMIGGDFSIPFTSSMDKTFYLNQASGYTNQKNYYTAKTTEDSAFGVLSLASSAVGSFVSKNPAGFANALEQRADKITNDAFGITGLKAKVADLHRQPHHVNGNYSKELETNFLYGGTSNSFFTFTVKSISNIEARNIAVYHHKYGYLLNQFLILTTLVQLNERYNFNYWKITNFTNCVDRNNLNQIEIDYLNKLFREGIRLWDSRVKFLEYNTENWEVSLGLPKAPTPPPIK